MTVLALVTHDDDDDDDSLFFSKSFVDYSLSLSSSIYAHRQTDAFLLEYISQL